MKIAFCTAECYPFAKTGGLADVCGALPIALEKQGVEVSLFLPRYKNITDDLFKIERIHEGLSKTSLGDSTVYLIENDAFFNRDGIYGDQNGDFQDNLDRFVYFCSQTLEAIKQLKLDVDIVHCHDWHAALIPVFLKERYQSDAALKDVKTLLTIHNLAFQGVFKKEERSKLGLDQPLKHADAFEFYDQLNLLKAAIIYSDEVSTVSPQYAKEIQTKDFGCGLEDVLTGRENEVVGILNGVDYELWNPETDTNIVERYGAENYKQAKQKNKVALQERFSLPVLNVPLFGLVSRITHQKGFELFLEAFDELKDLDLQIIVQGLGDERYISQLQSYAQANPEKLGVCFKFEEPLAHQIYAGADLFLVPSNFEPCGLSQMISMRYATIPLVYKTGGLADTVIDHTQSEGNGFVFERYLKDDFVKTVKKAIDQYKQTDQFGLLINNALKADFSLEQSAGEYKKTYTCLLSD